MTALKQEFSEEDLETIGERLRAGESFAAIGRDFNCTHQRIGRVAARLGLAAPESRRLATQQAREASARFAEEKRSRAISLLADRIIEQLETGDLSAGDLRNLAVALGVSIDKQRLEDGLSTANQAVAVKVGRWQRKEMPPGHE